MIEYRRTLIDTNNITEEGIVTAYLTKWDTVDTYNSTFTRGAFSKTFLAKAPNKIRLLWNHRDLAGKVLEAVEDDIGAKVTVKFNLETRTGQEAYSHVKHGDVDCFSFGFTSSKDAWKENVRQIQEVELFEVGPVIFEANQAATITDVRTKNQDDDFWKKINEIL